MNYADFNTQPLGFPLESDSTLGFMQNDYQSAINGLAGLAGGNNIIISGMIDSGASVSAGWAIVNGELMKFEGGVKSTNVVVVQTILQKQNDGGTLIDRYFTKVLKFGTGTGSFTYDSLIRIETVQGLTNKLISLFSFESEVIVKGCDVSNVTVSNCDIAPGVVLINNKFLTTGSYSGGFPVYINESGMFVNTAPTSNFIKFDPYSSQTFKAVFKRASTFINEVIEIVTLSDQWDNTGLGKWAYKGFALCNGLNGTVDKRGRFSVGYDERLTDPANGIWDASYNTPGNNGGAKGISLIADNIPPLNVTVNQGNSYVGAGPNGIVGRGAASPNTFDILTTGTGSSHENRPPWKVLVYAQRI